MKHLRATERLILETIDQLSEGAITYQTALAYIDERSRDFRRLAAYYCEAPRPVLLDSEPFFKSAAALHHNEPLDVVIESLEQVIHTVRDAITFITARGSK